MGAIATIALIIKRHQGIVHFSVININNNSLSGWECIWAGMKNSRGRRQKVQVSTGEITGTRLKWSKSTVCPTCGGLASSRAVTFPNLDSNQLEAHWQAGRCLQNFKTGKILPRAESHNHSMVLLLNSPSTPLRSYYHNCSGKKRKHTLFLVPITVWTEHSLPPTPQKRLAEFYNRISNAWNSKSSLKSQLNWSFYHCCVFAILFLSSFFSSTEIQWDGWTEWIEGKLKDKRWKTQS